MNSPQLPWPKRTCVLFQVLALFLFGVAATSAQTVQHLGIVQLGGMPGRPVMTGIQPGSNSVTLTWDGPSGYYQVFKKAGPNALWQPVGPRTNLVRRATVLNTSASALFKILGPAPQYAGAPSCIECHGPVHSTEQYTVHSQAFLTLQQIGQDKNPACLPCHTVGYGLPTGFVSLATTPQLAGVQCENCHGPAGNHGANPDDPTAIPRVEVAGTVCGGCHIGTQHPTYGEWSSSGHGTVTESNMNALTCGRCHIGPARIAMLKHEPVATNDTTLGVVCATCHDPHGLHAFTNALNGPVTFTNLLTGRALVITNAQLGPAYTNQLRNPVASTRDFYLTTADVFTNKYDPSINLCAQCHNHRGASWTNSTRAPHHSPQYNMLIGTVGELDGGLTPNFPSTHSRIEEQCVACHMQTSPHQNGPPEVAADTGHKFLADDYGACVKCHGSTTNAQGLVDFAKQTITFQLEQLKTLLDLWATTKAPVALSSKYGVRAWEYTSPGDLSSGGSGPNSTEQLLLPVNVRKARFNLYLVLYDGSFGAHNGPYAITLLDTAQGWMEQELSP